MVSAGEELLGYEEAHGGDWRRVNAFIDRVVLQSGEVIEFPRSGVTVIVGANNVGKSTFLRQLNQVLQTGQHAIGELRPRLFSAVEVHREIAINDLMHWFDRNGTLVYAYDGDPNPYFSLNGQHVSLEQIRSGALTNGLETLQGLYNLFVSFADATSRLNQPFNAGGRSAPDEPASASLHRFQDNRHLFEELSVLAEKVFDQPLLLDDFPGATIRIRVGTVDMPMPARNEPLGEFGRAVAQLVTLDDQGDGMRSFFGLVIPLVADERLMFLVDEPEAFLHPPQARALGRELSRAAKNKGVQIVVSTHDKDLIAGLLDSESDLTVVRLVRNESGTTRAQLSSERIREVWEDRHFRYSNILNGLFAQLVVICESDQDCRFYEAALDAYVSEHADSSDVYTLPASDVLFVSSNGKSGFGNLIRVLHDLAVPLVVVADIDLLRSPEQTKQVFQSLAGDWAEVERDYRVVERSMQRNGTERKVRTVLEVVTSVLQPLVAANNNAVYSRPLKETIDEQLKPGIDPWAAAKKSGMRAFSGEALSALEGLMVALDSQGLVIVQVGELEGFAPALAKSKEWLPKALAAEQHRSVEAAELVRRILAFGTARK